MTTNTAIEWTDHTYNPWVGCFKVSAGCKQCYMYREQSRYGNDPKDIRRVSDATFYKPLKWAKDDANIGKFVFTCSWSDFFIEAADGWRDDAWNVIRETPELCYLILTKRADRIIRCLPRDWGQGWHNVWLGVSVETQHYTERIDYLLEVPAAKRFISYEPALELVDFSQHMDGIDWLIAGGESGYAPRIALPAWFKSARDQAKAANVAFFFKQWGGKPGSKRGGDDATLDGVRWTQRPEFVPQIKKQLSMF